MFGFFGLMAAPMDSVMQRDYWTAKLTAEAEAEQLEEELDAVLQEIAFGEITLTCEQIDAANREAGRLAAPCELTVGFTGVTNAHR